MRAVRHGTRPLLIALTCAHAACAARAPAVAPPVAASSPSDAQRVAASPAPDPAPTFVVAPRGVALYLSPEDAAPVLVWRSPEEIAQARAEAEAAALELARAEAQKRERVAKAKKKRAKKKRAKKRPRKKKLSAAARRAVAKRARERAARQRRAAATRIVRQRERDAAARPLADPRRDYMALRLVRWHDTAWAEVETLTAEEGAQHCWLGPLIGLEAARLRLFVRRDALMPVLRRQEELTLEGERPIRLQPGVVITARDDDLAQVEVDGYRWRLAVPADQIGAGYYRPQRFDVPETSVRFTPEALAHGLVRLDKDQVMPQLPYLEQRVHGVAQRGKRVVVSSRSPCGAWTLRAVAGAIEEVSERPTRRLSGMGAPSTRAHARAGATLYATDGRALGQLIAPLAITSVLQQRGQRLCFEVRAYGEVADKLPPWRAPTLCVDAEQIASPRSR